MSIETITFSKCVLEDLDIGGGTRDIRLADGSIITAHQLSIPSLAILKTGNLSATNGAVALTLSQFISAGSTVLGVTTKLLTALGASGGLTAFAVGDGSIIDRWGQSSTFTQNAVTEGGSFTPGAWPIYASANDVVISAIGGTFDGVGNFEISLHFFKIVHRTAS